MWSKVVSFSLKNWVLVVAAAVLALVAGYQVLSRMPVDVYPDITDPRVTILTEAPGWSPEEVETLVTFPLESVFNGMPFVKRVRSSSGIGLSVVIVEFEWGTDVFRARQIVAERLATVNLPSGAEAPFMTPIASRLGEIVEFALVDEKKTLSPLELRDLADWVIRFRLQSAGGIANILNMGGFVKEYQVIVHPVHLAHFGLSLREIFEALQQSNLNAAGGFSQDLHQEYLIRGLGRIQTLADIENVVITTRAGGLPVYVKDVAEVKIAGPAVRRGAGSRNGDEAVLGRVVKQPGTNTLELTAKVFGIFEQLKPTLPDGVRIATEYVQAEVIERAIRTVRESFLEGAILVVVILFVFLWNLRASLITLTAIPLSLVLGVVFIAFQGMTLNVMTLAALTIAVGLVVDDAIIVVENIHRRLREASGQISPLGHEARRGIVLAATREIVGSVVYATVIIMLVFLPIFAFKGIEGRLFGPLATTVIVAMGASLLVSVTLNPALSYLFLASRSGASYRESPVLTWVHRWYRPLLTVILRHRWPVVIVVLAIIALAMALTPFVGKEFLPIMDEGTYVINVRMLPGTSLEESLRIGRQVERALLEIPEVVSTSARTGRAEQDEHAEGVNVNEILVNVKPPEQRTRSRDVILAAIREKLEQFPGAATFVGQPIQHRIDELLSGVTAQVAIKLFGPDLEVLRSTSQDIAAAVRSVRGAADVLVEQQVDVPQLQIQVDRNAAARYGLSVGQVSRFVETAFKGEAATQVIAGQRTYDLVVILDHAYRDDVEKMRQLLIDTPAGPEVPLERVAQIRYGKGPNTINRENVSRRIVIQSNVQGRDLGGFIAEAQSAVARRVTLPEGYFVVYGGQFEAQQEAMRQLVLLGGLILVAVFLLLYMSLGSVTSAVLVMFNLPFALAGGIFAVFLSGGVLSIPSAIGFILLFGIAIRNGIILIMHIKTLQEQEGLSLEEAILRGAEHRVSPVLMTALAAGIGMVPLALATGSGAEVLKPLATVIVGGMVTSTALTLLALPAFYSMVENLRVRSRS
ncbi:MAG: efflux RND transporter permease subunit [Nitrospirae bacterium]|nr:efflux RND transporter permease subunit [Nitrospirota bacterium]